MLTAEYARAIKLLEEIGKNAEIKDSFSDIQSAIKVLRMELDREMDRNEMSKFRREVVLLHPDEELRGTATPEREERNEQPGLRSAPRQTAVSVTHDIGSYDAGRNETPAAAGLRGVESIKSVPMIREADSDRIRIKLSSMKIERIGRNQKATTQPAAGGTAGMADDSSLIRCSSCGAMISRKSVVCVSCGEFVK
ncbi:MAG: hypothetical protein M1117_02085 [Candidatus Thermoplasmatota archaeon]|nr:hypothetical protein [Candidatus Thermoplasmatota archaeon]